MFADKNIADWIYNKGSEDNIVLYSKVSIYRNLENIRFHYHMDKDEIDKVDSILKKNIEELNLNLTEIKLKNIDFSNINILKENLTLPKPDIKIDINNPKKDAELIAKAYNIPIEFNKKCLEEAKSLPDNLENEPLEFDRIDLRDLKTITIDGADSKDFDDAISVEKLKDGYKIGVHIADVSHFVDMGSALDREARKRGNSVYLIDKVYPMFPHELSNGICSLNEGVSRFAMTVFINIDNKGNVRESSFHKSVSFLSAIKKSFGFPSPSSIILVSFKLNSMLPFSILFFNNISFISFASVNNFFIHSSSSSILSKIS